MNYLQMLVLGIWDGVKPLLWVVVPILIAALALIVWGVRIMRKR